MIKAKKHFGQNFLKDKNVLHKITQAIPNYVNYIVEIGPGLGDLTQELLKKCKVEAYEIDDELIPFLESKFQKQILGGEFKLFHLNASEFFSRALATRDYFLVANLPYYMASSLVLQALEDNKCLGLLVMLQKEVVQKFCANRGEKEYCAISIISSLFCERLVLFDVDKESFYPEPKVKSSVMLLEKKQQAIDLFDLEPFKDFLRDCFKSPRKQLVSNLKDKQNSLYEILNSLGIENTVRPHQLDVNDYLKIFTHLKEYYERGNKAKQKRNTS